MNSKLTVRYIVSVIVVSIAIILIDFISGAVILSKSKAVNGKTQEVESYVRNFSNYINVENDEISISKDGQESLQKQNLWIQVLDENSQEVSSYLKPQNVQTRYTGIELINSYKYGGDVDGKSEILFGGKKIDGRNYTYLIGYPMAHVRKYIFIFDNDSILGSISETTVPILMIDFVVIILLAYLFSISLTRPIKYIVTGIGDLAQNNKTQSYKEKGIYATVFKQLNYLSLHLNENELERKKLERMREEWIANISHDIKTPLASIHGYAELMDGEYECDLEEVKEYAEIIKTKSQYITGLIEDLNLTMKLENSKDYLHKERTNLVPLLKSTIIEVFNDPVYSGVNIEFQCEQEEAWCELDKKMICRAINNLIYNSLIHNDNTICIVVRLFVDQKIHIWVTDNGKGIKKEDIPYIFDRYYRGTNTGEAHKGSGLGMAIVKDIILSHNGTIQITSEEGEGMSTEIIL